MLTFLLGVLKVIGIVLLIILLLILLLLSIVLFVPIRYKGNGVINDTEKNVQFKITWLLHALSVKIKYIHPGKPDIIIKVLGFQLGKKKKSKKKEQSSATEQTSDIPLDTNSTEQNPVIDSDISSTNNSEDTQPQSTLNSEHQQAVDEYLSEKAKPKESFKEKINKIVNKITSIYNKIKGVFLNIKYYLDVIQEKETKDLLSKVFESILKILKSIRPRKLVVNATVGFDNPDTTGKMYGAYWVAKPILGEHVEITPDFENKIIEGDFNLKGKITIFVLAINGLKILLNKNFKPVIKKFKNGGPKNGGEN